MKKIVGLIIAISVVITLVGVNTHAFFTDMEATDENYFNAGVIDLEIDLTEWDDVAGEPVVIWGPQDDPLPKIFE